MSSEMAQKPPQMGFGFAYYQWHLVAMVNKGGFCTQTGSLRHGHPGCVQKMIDRQYAALERDRPRAHEGERDYRSFNDYCRQMDEWTERRNQLLDLDGEMTSIIVGSRNPHEV